ncbi:hypothetical protein RZS28_05045 [Methylocapsa polymorpha]|uniref:Uncharacterized protein n=1 Tax=Methylocapsa polymorpha TaxID=3080828 RepID=A0ABZ0HXQ6_9HYPH|nr:hypothetical protein RZS28_05045 [Methylocapsa sp. RX1]
MFPLPTDWFGLVSLSWFTRCAGRAESKLCVDPAGALAALRLF